MSGATGEFEATTVVITGASAGIGAAAARRFAEGGAELAVVGRSPEKTKAVAAEVGGRAFLVDYGSLADVRRLASDLLATYDTVDLLANNAGAMFSTRRLSTDGFEMTFQVNHLAPFLLTHLLLDRLESNPRGARVINTASTQYRKARLDLDDLDRERVRYRPLPTYGASKLATVLFTQELARRTAPSVTVAAFHPGAVATEFTRDNAWQRALMGTWLGRAVNLSPDQGAAPLVHLARADRDEINGRYLHRLEVEDLRHPQANEEDLAARLWERSAELVGITARRP